MRHQAPLFRSLALALSCAAALSACSGGDETKVAAGSTPAPSPSPTQTPSPTPPPPPDLLTGAQPAAGGPVVAVKIDNAPLARQYHKGLDRAAVVYQELVEGGLTRFLALYEVSQAGSADVGPVRSARESDIPVLRMYNNPPIAFSGAQDGVLAIFRSAARNKWLKDGSYDALPSAYRLGAQRKDARNFFVDLEKLASLNPTNKATDVGFTFSAIAPVGPATPTATAAYSGHTRVGLTYDASTRTWRITQNGTPMPGVAPANVVVQRVVESRSRFVDVHKQPTPYTTTTGSGAVTVLRDGVRVSGTWKRVGFGATRFYDTAGKQIALRPGPTWVLLLPTTGALGY